MNAALGGFLVFIGLALLACQQQMPGNNEIPLRSASELSGKEEWSVLQAVELTYRKGSINEPYVILKAAKNSRFTVIGVAAAKNRTGEYVWIIANPVSEPPVKQLPKDVEFSLTQRDYHDVIATASPHAHVAAFLRSRVIAN